MCKTLEHVCCYYAEFGVEDLEKAEERKKPLKSQTTANRSSGWVKRNNYSAKLIGFCMETDSCQSDVTVFTVGAYAPIYSFKEKAGSVDDGRWSQTNLLNR